MTLGVPQAKCPDANKVLPPRTESTYLSVTRHEELAGMPSQRLVVQLESKSDSDLPGRGIRAARLCCSGLTTDF